MSDLLVGHFLYAKIAYICDLILKKSYELSNEFIKIENPHSQYGLW